MTTTDLGLYMTAREVCARLSITERTLSRWIEAGRITAYRLPGGHRRFTANDVDALITDRSA